MINVERNLGMVLRQKNATTTTTYRRWIHSNKALSQHGPIQQTKLKTSGTHSYRVCHGFSLTKRDDFFRVDFDHF